MRTAYAWDWVYARLQRVLHIILHPRALFMRFLRSARDKTYLLRQMAVFSVGWHRPPLALWLGPVSVLNRLFDSRPFLSGQTPENDGRLAPTAFYIMPDGLLLYFRLFALLYALAFLASCWGHGSGALSRVAAFLPTVTHGAVLFCVLTVFSALLIYAFLAGVLPWIIYCAFRRPVLTALSPPAPGRSLPLHGSSAGWPAALQDWFMAIPTRVVKARRQLHRQCFIYFLVPRVWSRHSSYWTRQNFQQMHYLRAGVSELYYSPGEVFSPGFMRWLLHYCAPVWAAYGALVVLGLLRVKPIWLLVALGFSWWLISILFFLREVRTLQETLATPDSASRLLPQSMRPLVQTYSILQKSIPRWGFGALNAISAVAFLAFLTMLQVIQ